MNELSDREKAIRQQRRAITVSGQERWIDELVTEEIEAMLCGLSYEHLLWRRAKIDLLTADSQFFRLTLLRLWRFLRARRG